MKKTLIFDIETGPLPEDQILPNMPPWEAPGNIKDPIKLEAHKANYAKEYVAKAALSPLTGQVLAVGFLDAETHAKTIVCRETEAETLKAALAIICDMGKAQSEPRLVGFNSHSFDLPFIWRRCWALFIQPPYHLRHGRYWQDCYSVDLREAWQFGNRMEPGSLDAICRTLGCGQKNGDGALFYKVLAEDRAKALAYLANDLDMTYALFCRMFPGEGY
jgi:hypothetical protein